MSKWKCEICGNEFENFHAQGFDNKIYCPLCYFKKENQKLETEKEQLNSLVNSCQEEIRILKKQLKEKENIACDWKDSCLENAGKIEILENQQKEFISYLENEKDRLARECSHIYENSLGKTRLVNEDIFNEVDTILSKYKEIIGVSK